MNAAEVSTSNLLQMTHVLNILVFKLLSQNYPVTSKTLKDEDGLDDDGGKNETDAG